MAFMPSPGGGIRDRSTSTSSSRFMTPDALLNDSLKVKLEQERLKKAIEEAKGRSGSSLGATGLSADQREVADRDFRSKESDKAYERQRQLNADRAGADAQAKADETANLIRLRREASSRGLGVSRAISRSRR